MTGIDLNNDGDFLDATEVAYEYDGLGRRIQKDFAAGSRSRFSGASSYYNEQRQAMELTHVNGARSRNEVSLRSRI